MRYKPGSRLPRLRIAALTLSYKRHLWEANRWLLGMGRGGRGARHVLLLITAWGPLIGKNCGPYLPDWGEVVLGAIGNAGSPTDAEFLRSLTAGYVVSTPGLGPTSTSSNADSYVAVRP